MRERKYRAWIKSAKCWQLKENVEWTPIRELMGIGNVDDLEWIEFTGLLDKNGKEIWEGDILQSPDKLARYQVIFDDGSFLAKRTDVQWYRESYEMKFDEVIGNIYSNPELMEGK